MRKRVFTFLSADGKTEIHGVEWMPNSEDEIKAVLQISHGVTEYIERYEEFAKFMTENGIMVVGNDHLGHGLSVEKSASPMYFGPRGSWEYAVRDLLNVYELVKSDHPNVGYYILGFSMGSFLVRKLLIDYPSKIDAAILMGTGQIGKIPTALGLLAAKSEAAKVGENNTSEGIESLTFGTYNKRFAPNKTKFDWLCSDEESLAEYAKDPKIGGPMSAGLFREMLYGMEYTRKSSNVKKMRKSMPILIMSGEDDSVGDCGKGVRKVYKSFKKAGMVDVKIKLYPSLRHDLLHEVNRKEIFRDILNWMNSAL